MSSMINFYNKKEVKKYDKKYENPCFNSTHLKHPFRAILVGASGSGKTQTLMNLIKAMSGTWDYVILAVKTRHEPLYEWFIEKCKGMISVFEDGNVPTMKDIDEITRNGKDQVLVIYDDLVLMKNQQPIEEAYIRARKKNCSLIYLTQSYYRCPKSIRINCNYIFLKKLSSNRDLKAILREYDTGKSEKEIMEIYKQATSNQLDFLTIRLDEMWDSDLKFTKNFLDSID